MENLAGTRNLKKKRERAYLNRKKNVKSGIKPPIAQIRNGNRQFQQYIRKSRREN